MVLENKPESVKVTFIKEEKKDGKEVTEVKEVKWTDFVDNKHEVIFTTKKHIKSVEIVDKAFVIKEFTSIVKVIAIAFLACLF